MGFEAQLTEILHKLPQSRQTLLFSATLPESLVEFAKAGLQDPLLIRLDVEQKISEDLETAFFTIKDVDKQAGLLYILQEIIKIPSLTSQPVVKKRSASGITPHSTLIFVSTKHQVEFITALLRKANYSVSHVYGSLDQIARKENVQAFRSGESSILVVTDVAARGIDIPILSNVINYDFPSESKVFVHRVGRTARAGQRGWAYSLVTVDDAPYFCELVMFLGRRLVLNGVKNVNYANDLALGGIPRADLERIGEWVEFVVGQDGDLSALKNVAAKGNKLYLKTRGTRSGEVIKKAKALVREEGWNLVNPLLGMSHESWLMIVGEKQDYEDARLKLLNSVSGFRPKETIFEIGHKGSKGKAVAAQIMRARRDKIQPNENTTKDQEEEGLEEVSEPSKLVEGLFRDPENYIAHFEPGNAAQEHGYDVHRPTNSFVESSRQATMNLAGDDDVSFAPSRPKQRWDPKKKNFVNRTNDDDGSGGKNIKMIKGESGVKIPASMKSGR
jgi:ATP-dependent RNA helicase DDX54/DBP10